jgi:hypothetical protein
MSQYDDYIRDLHAVIAGDKPAVIVEFRKSPKAYMQVMPIAKREGLTTHQQALADSKGVKHAAIMAARDSRVLTRIVKLLSRRNTMTRDRFQITLGTLLGYSLDDCQDYVVSRLSKTCGCQLCGGPTRESRLDDEIKARRTVMYV